MWHGCFTASATDLAAGWLLSDSQKTLSTWWHSDITWRSSLAANDASKCFTFGCVLSCDSASGSLADVGSCAVEGQASRAVSHSQEQWRSLHGESVASAVALCKVHTTWHCSHLLLCALLLRRPTAAAIDRYLLPARLTAANPPPPQRHAVVDRRAERRTDGRTPYRYTDPGIYYSSTVKVMVELFIKNWRLRMCERSKTSWLFSCATLQWPCRRYVDPSIASQPKDRSYVPKILGTQSVLV